jgi:hypothetical protein
MLLRDSPRYDCNTLNTMPSTNIMAKLVARNKTMRFMKTSKWMRNPKMGAAERFSSDWQR